MKICQLKVPHTMLAYQGVSGGTYGPDVSTRLPGPLSTCFITLMLYDRHFFSFCNLFKVKGVNIHFYMYFLNKKNNKTMYNWRRHWRFHHEQMTDAGCYCLVHAAIFWFFQLASALHQSTSLRTGMDRLHNHPGSP